MPSRPLVRHAIALLLAGIGACTPRPASESASDSTSTASQPPAGGSTDSVTRASAPRRSYVGDTTTYAATDAELAELRRALIIPVVGVRAADLRDTYTEARGAGRVHDAIDILAPRGTPVVAATDGTLYRLHHSVAGGLMVYEGDASDRFVLMYGHLDRYAAGLVEGSPLHRGQVIGYVGTTGNAPVGTPHLHFAIARGRPSAAWWRGTAVNPYPLLTAVDAGR